MISATMRLLLEKYDPASELLIEPQEPLQPPVTAQTNKQVPALTLAQRIDVLRSQGSPQFVIDILSEQLKVNLASEGK
jgi:hypothetical protein